MSDGGGGVPSTAGDWPMISRINFVLQLFGVRLVPVSWFDTTAQILAENTRLRAIVDSMRPVVVRHVHKYDVN